MVALLSISRHSSPQEITLFFSSTYSIFITEISLGNLGEKDEESNMKVPKRRREGHDYEGGTCCPFKVMNCVCGDLLGTEQSQESVRPVLVCLQVHYDPISPPNGM